MRVSGVEARERGSERERGKERSWAAMGWVMDQGNSEYSVQYESDGDYEESLTGTEG